MNIQQIAAKYKISENFLNSRDDGFNISIESVDDIILELKKGITEPEQTIKKLQKIREFMFDVRNSTF
jgi:hypothetical protein